MNSELKKVLNYKDLDVWKNGIQIVDVAYELTQSFPQSERFGLVSQMQRAAVSIPANIAEGATRRLTKEFQQFCSIALGSCAELETLLIISKRRNYVNEGKFVFVTKLLETELRMLMGLIKSLRLKHV